jgi:uncharacterized protein
METLSVEFPRQRLFELCRRHRIKRLALFGSALRDDFSADSDIDLLVEFEPGIRIGLAFFAIERELSELLGRRVDLNTQAFISPEFRDAVNAEARTLYESPG